MKARKPDCVELSGLDPADLAACGGFTRRAWAALAHLREAWLSADGQNAGAIEDAIIALLRGHSFADNAETVARILDAHHERGLAARIDERARVRWAMPGIDWKGFP